MRKAVRKRGWQRSVPYGLAKAAALFHGIIRSHAFVDGNKRTATLTAFLFLVASDAIQDDVVTALHLRLIGDIALETASKGLTVEVITDWFKRILGR